jgi:hypothetical protein
MKPGGLNRGLSGDKDHSRVRFNLRRSNESDLVVRVTTFSDLGGVMLVKGVGALAIMLCLTPGALAGGRSNILTRVSCTVVRYYVAKYSASAAEMWARSHGATDAEIEAARHCLRDRDTAAQTAQAARWWTER